MRQIPRTAQGPRRGARLPAWRPGFRPERMVPRHWEEARKLVASGLLAIILASGCATYHRKALPSAPDLATAPALNIPVSQLEVPGLKPHLVNPTNGLDETTVITLAVLYNPDLKAARLQAGVARAQVLEAGLLPDPQAIGGLSWSTVHSGYDIGLSEDLQALVTRGAAKAAAKAHEREVNLQILWQEWQVAEKARELFIQTLADEELYKILRTNSALLAKRYRGDQAQMEQRNATASAVTADFLALSAADAQRRQLELQANDDRHALNQLMGLRPNTKLRLRGHAQTSLPSAQNYRHFLNALPHRRPDLLALQAGYESQEENLRKAVLAQFPAMSAGVEQTRDPVEGINSFGVTVNLTLPLFNRNRGQIAIQHATRALLYQTYQARLDQAVNEADRVWRAAQIMSRQLEALQKHVDALAQEASAVERDFQAGNLSLGAYVSLESGMLTEQATAVRLRTSLRQATSILDALVCLPFGDSEGMGPR